MKRCYVPKKFSVHDGAVIDTANEILEEYAQQGLAMSLRQLYYQFVARGMLPNEKRSYDRLGSLVNDARLAGLISWTSIEDRTRGLRGTEHVENVQQALKQARAGFALDLWAAQPMRPEVWIEKDALVGVIESVCAQLRVDFFACRGYNSQSEQWRAGRRLAAYVQKGQCPIIFHLGDHDPSGIDMTRDNADRLSMFAGVPVQVVRLGLNFDQVERYAPPPNPVKLTDSRSPDYVRKFGDESWELDALPPNVIRDLISDAVGKVRNEVLWDAALHEEAAERDRLDNIIEES